MKLNRPVKSDKRTEGTADGWEKAERTGTDNETIDRDPLLF